MLEVYTDGSSLGNPGPGGWGFVIAGSPCIEKAGGVPDTTNNRMELLAVIEALKYLLDKNNITYRCEGFETDMGLFAAPTTVDTSESSKKTYDDVVALYTDSNYVKQGITERIHTWIKRNWRLSKGGKLVKNADLWKELHELVGYFEKLSRHWVKAHVGNEWNERVDDLARGAAEAL